MKGKSSVIEGSLKGIFAAAGTIVVLSACAGGSSTPMPSSASANAAEGGLRASWMAPDATYRSKLLYLSSQLGDVYVYSYPKLKPEGQLTGFSEPGGLCSDKNGNVFVVDSRAAEIFEFAHGGKTPIATLSDPNQFPSGCAVDPLSGNLAVTNISTVAIYAKAQGSPTIYKPAKIQSASFCGYDNQGNLFVDGMRTVIAPSGAKQLKAEFSELPYDAKAFENIVLDQLIHLPAGIQWDGKYFAVADSVYLGRGEAAIDRVALSGTTGKVVQTWVMIGAVGAVQFWKQGDQIVVPQQSTSPVGIWTYLSPLPANKTIDGIQDNVGATVSEAAE